jgi:tetratricopeptide (TPR) repeat protein
LIQLKSNSIFEKVACVAAAQVLLALPTLAQDNSALPPLSPQPPVSAQPAVLPQTLPGRSSPPALPFNFQQFNNLQQNMQAPPQQQPQVPVFQPFQNGAPNELDPFIRGKMLIRQATDLISSGQLDPAIGLLQKSMEYRRVDPTPQFLLGLIYDQKGNPKLALTNYSASVKKATALGMDSSQLRINLGNTLVKLNFLKEAEFDYKRALEIDDKNEIAHLNYGRLLLFKGDYSGSFRELQRAHELMATDPNLPLYEALALKGMGNIAESRQQLQVFLDRAKGINSDPQVINMAENLLAGMK